MQPQYLLVILRSRQTLHFPVLPMFRGQAQRSNLQQLQQALRVVRDLVARWGVRMAQVRREKEVRAPVVANVPGTVASEGETATRTVHPREHYWAAADQVHLMQTAPPRRFL